MFKDPNPILYEMPNLLSKSHNQFQNFLKYILLFPQLYKKANHNLSLFPSIKPFKYKFLNLKY